MRETSAPRRHADDAFDPFRSLQRSRSADQNHFRSAPRRRLGYRVAHLPRRAIGDESNGIDRFARGTGCDDDATARQCARSTGLEHASHVREDRLRFGHSARALALSRGESSLFGAQDAIADLPQVRHVVPRLRMRPHVIVHRWNQEHRSFRREEDRRQ